jgi:hypothetical protein
MTRSRSTFISTAVTAALAGLLSLAASACKQPPPALVDAGAPAPVATDAAPTVLAPLDEDAGVDAAVPAVKHATGPGLNTNQLRAKQCCNALKQQAGTDPTLMGVVAVCNSFAAQLGPSAGGQAPEFAAVRSMLKGHNMPAVCQGL